MNGTVNDGSPAKKPKALPHLLPLMLEALAPLGHRAAQLRSPASSNKGHSGNVQTVVKWAISRQIKSVPPGFVLMMPLLFVPLPKGKGRFLPLLHHRGRGQRMLPPPAPSPPILMMAGCLNPDGAQHKARWSTCTHGQKCTLGNSLAEVARCSRRDQGHFSSSSHTFHCRWLLPVRFITILHLKPSLR